jgi:oligopeptide/dipeptide ABC transporter ATP-binding protein
MGPACHASASARLAVSTRSRARLGKTNGLLAPPPGRALPSAPAAGHCRLRRPQRAAAARQSGPQQGAAQLSAAWICSAGWVMAEPQGLSGARRGGTSDLSLCSPRPQRSQAHQQSRGGDVCRPSGRDGINGRALCYSQAPYTAALLSAVPEPDPRQRAQRLVRQGEVANPAMPPPGCYFHPRCSHAVEICRTRPPTWEKIAPGHFVSCHRASELRLSGVHELGSPHQDR